MGKVQYIEELYLLKYQGLEEGLDFRSYLQKLKMHDIPLEIAVDNARKGISTSEYLKQREKLNRRKRILDRAEQVYGGVMFAGLVCANLYLASVLLDLDSTRVSSPSVYSEERIQLPELTENMLRAYGWQK